MYEKNQQVCLRYKTAKHAQGAKAKVIQYPSKKGEDKVDVRFEGELYVDDEIETYPTSLFTPC